MASRVSKITSKTNMANWRQMMRASLIRSGALIGAAALGLFGLFYGLSVLSYSAADAAFNSAAANVQHNWMGQTGAYLGDAALINRPNGLTATPEEMHDYVYLRGNPAGEHRELWYHEQGDRSWLVVTRNTITHEILAVEMARDAARKQGRSK